MNDLEKYRQEIEAITKEMLDLLEKRLELSKEVARYKKEHQMPIRHHHCHKDAYQVVE